MQITFFLCTEMPFVYFYAWISQILYEGLLDIKPKTRIGIFVFVYLTFSLSIGIILVMNKEYMNTIMRFSIVFGFTIIGIFLKLFIKIRICDKFSNSKKLPNIN